LPELWTPAEVFVDAHHDKLDRLQTDTEERSDAEDELKSEIQALWSAHQLGSATSKRTKEELNTLRLGLGQKLCEMKATLVRTGRLGGWSAYLRSCDIPRATGERYIKQHEALFKLDSKRVTETISEPSEEDVRRLVRSLLPRLQRVLVTSGWVARFLEEVALQWAVADGSPTRGGVDGPGLVAVGHDDSPSETEVAELSAA
jgi:hypothetical protein